MRILIADNNVELCRVLQQFLSTHEEFDVVGIAHDGEQALEKIQDLEPDVILLDITMPYLDGLGVLESLKTLKLTRNQSVCDYGFRQRWAAQPAVGLGCRLFSSQTLSAGGSSGKAEAVFQQRYQCDRG